MLQVCLAILLSGFSILGAYYIALAVGSYMMRRYRLSTAVILFAKSDSFSVLENIKETRKNLPYAQIYVCTERPDLQIAEIGGKPPAVSFVTSEELPYLLQRDFRLQTDKNTV